MHRSTGRGKEELLSVQLAIHKHARGTSGVAVVGLVVVGTGANDPLLGARRPLRRDRQHLPDQSATYNHA